MGALTALVGNPWGKGEGVEEGFGRPVVGSSPRCYTDAGFPRRKPAPSATVRTAKCWPLSMGPISLSTRDAWRELPRLQGQRWPKPGVGSYLTGLLGAIIGGLLATIPAVAVILVHRDGLFASVLPHSVGGLSRIPAGQGKMDGIVLPLDLCPLYCLPGWRPIMNLAISMVANEIP